MGHANKKHQTTQKTWLKLSVWPFQALLNGWCPWTVRNGRFSRAKADEGSSRSTKHVYGYNFTRKFSGKPSWRINFIDSDFKHSSDPEIKATAMSHRFQTCPKIETNIKCWWTNSPPLEQVVLIICFQQPWHKELITAAIKGFGRVVSLGYPNKNTYFSEQLSSWKKWPTHSIYATNGAF